MLRERRKKGIMIKFITEYRIYSLCQTKTKKENHLKAYNNEKGNKKTRGNWFSIKTFILSFHISQKFYEYKFSILLALTMTLFSMTKSIFYAVHKYFYWCIFSLFV